MHQGLGDQHTPLHAARQRAHHRAALVGEFEFFQQMIDPRPRLASAAVVTGLDAQHVGDVEERVEHQLLRHHADVHARGAPVGHGVFAQHRDASAVGTIETGDQIDQRGLARTIGPEQAEELAATDGKIHAIQGLSLPVSFTDACNLDRCGHVPRILIEELN